MYCPDFKVEAENAIGSIPDYKRLFGKKVLITGGTGMICSAVADILFALNERYQANISIIFAGRKRESLESRFPDSKWGYVKFDATQPYNYRKNVDFVIYGASNADPSAVFSHPVETIMANTSGLNDILNHTIASRYLYISSSEVYGNGGKAPYVEDDYGFVDLLNVRACYPCSKRLAETICISYMHEYGKDCVIVRPGHIYGPTISKRDSRASAQFSRMAADGKEIVMKSAGAQLRSYCYVYDCASAILTVLLNGESGNAYNISNKDSVCTIREIADALAIAGDTHVVFEIPSEDEKKSYNLMTNSSLDSAKLEALGWHGITNIKRGSERTIEILRKLK